MPVGMPPNRREFLRIGGSAVAVAALARCNDGLERGQFAAGDASAFELGTVTRFDEGPFFIGRDDDGLYAMAAVCPHNGCTVAAGEAEISCPCHLSVFAFDGTRLAGLATVGLEHLSLVVEESGRVVVDTNVTVADDTRVPVS